MNYLQKYTQIKDICPLMYPISNQTGTGIIRHYPGSPTHLARNIQAQNQDRQICCMYSSPSNNLSYQLGSLLNGTKQDGNNAKNRCLLDHLSFIFVTAELFSRMANYHQRKLLLSPSP